MGRSADERVSTGGDKVFPWGFVLQNFYKLLLMCNPSFKDFGMYEGLWQTFSFSLLPLNPASGPSHSFTSGSFWGTGHSLWRLQKGAWMQAN